MLKFQGIFKPLLGLALAATLAGSAMAATTGQRSGHDPLQRLQGKLGLSDDQVAQLRPTFDSFKQRHQAEHEAFKAQLMGILTPDQQAQLQSQKGTGKHGFKDLGLSDDQKSQLKALHEQNKPAHMAERQQMTAQIMAVLTPDQQAKFQQMQQKHSHHQAQ